MRWISGGVKCRAPLNGAKGTVTLPAPHVNHHSWISYSQMQSYPHWGADTNPHLIHDTHASVEKRRSWMMASLSADPVSPDHQSDTNTFFHIASLTASRSMFSFPANLDLLSSWPYQSHTSFTHLKKLPTFYDLLLLLLVIVKQNLLKVSQNIAIF